ncbi:MAG TPA: redoxin domain-containing protein [Kofleriaceae bacterium]
MRAWLIVIAGCSAAAKPTAPPQTRADAGPGAGPAVATWIGVITDPATARVEQVVPGAPADQAGIKVGDQVVSIAGHDVTTGKQVVETAHTLKPEQKAPIVVKRGGANVPLTVTAKPRPDPAQVQASFISKAAPVIALHGIDGGALALALDRDRVTVLDFWATWCKPCLYTTPHLDDLATRYPQLQVIGISDEEAADLHAHLAGHPVRFPQARDEDEAAHRAYLVQGLPTIIVIDRGGIVRWATVGVPDLDALDALVARLMK